MNKFKKALEINQIEAKILKVRSQLYDLFVSWDFSETQSVTYADMDVIPSARFEEWEKSLLVEHYATIQREQEKIRKL